MRRPPNLGMPPNLAARLPRNLISLPPRAQPFSTKRRRCKQHSGQIPQREHQGSPPAQISSSSWTLRKLLVRDAVADPPPQKSSLRLSPVIWTPPFRHSREIGPRRKLTTRQYRRKKLPNRRHQGRLSRPTARQVLSARFSISFAPKLASWEPTMRIWRPTITSESPIRRWV